MIWSPEQTRAHEESAESFREMYVHGQNKFTSLDDIGACKRRCITLIEKIDSRIVRSKVDKSRKEIEEINGLYVQDILILLLIVIGI